jgi:hypothetical protein
LDGPHYVYRMPCTARQAREHQSRGPTASYRRKIVSQPSEQVNLRLVTQCVSSGELPKGIEREMGRHEVLVTGVLRVGHQGVGKRGGLGVVR